MCGHAPDGCMSRMTGELFIGDHVQLNIGFAAARTRLGTLASGGVLLCASEHAYGETITGLAEAGSAPGASQLAGVRPGEITETCGTAQLPVHWEATTGDGNLFPALDADLTLTPAGDQTTVFALTGVFRPPPGQEDTNSRGGKPAHDVVVHPRVGQVRRRPENPGKRKDRGLVPRSGQGEVGI